MTTEPSNQIRGIMKTFGLGVPAGEGNVFEKNVRNLLSGHDGLAHMVLPLLDAWKGLRARAAELGRQLVRPRCTPVPCVVRRVFENQKSASADTITLGRNTG